MLSIPSVLRRSGPWLAGAYLLTCFCLGPPAGAVNSPPQAQLRSFHFVSTPMPVEIFIDLLAYASDADGDVLTCTVEVEPVAGTWALAPSADPSQGCAILYFPDHPEAPQTDSLAYRVEDPWGGSASAFVDILPANTVPGPKSLSVAPIPSGPHTIEVSWLDAHANRATYELFSRAQGVGSYSSLALFQPPFGQTVLSYTDTGLEPETTYFYYLTSCVEGSCLDGPVASATTPALPLTPDLAADDSLTLPRESIRFIAYDEILNNDDPSFGPLTVVAVAESTGVNNTPRVEWLPERSGILVTHLPANPSSFTFSYTVEAGGFQDSADVTLSFVAGANPIANPDGCPQTGYLCTPVSEGTALRIPYAVLTANDAVEGGGPTTGLDIRRGSFSKPENGRIDLCCDPDAFWYVPDEDFVGDDVFTYQLSNDGNPAIATAEVVVQVAGNGPATDPTQAAYDWIRLDLPASGSVSVPITFSELLQNDSGDDLELIQPCAHQPNIGTLNCPNTDPVHGYMVYETSGFLTTSFVYFRYDIQGADGQTSSSTNSQIFRTRPSDPRLIVGTSDLMQVPEGENLVVGWADLLDNDRIPYSGGSTNPLDFVDYFGAGRPLHGSARHVGTAWGGFTYQAPTNFLGADRMAYTVLDPVSGERGVAQLVVEVTPGAPIAQDDRLYTYPDLPRQLGVLVNDLDPQGQSQTDSLEVVAVGELLSGEGSATLGAGGEVWYTPGGYLHDPATFTYTVEDIWGNQATALVAVILTQPPEPQAAVLCEALHCLFTDHSTGAELQLRWTFLGGIEANVAAVEMDFSQPGTYPVTLEVTDALGTVDSVSLDAEVSGQEVHDPPVAVLEARHLTGTHYEFDLDGTSDDVGIASWSLDVDGTVLSPESTVVPWTFPAIATTRPVTLTVTDYAGQTGQVTVLVEVDPGPPSEEI